jgi:hypothetical protein
MTRRTAAVLVGVVLTGCGTGKVAAPTGEDVPQTSLQVRTVQGRLLHTIALAPTAGATEPVLAGDVVLVTTEGGSRRTGSPMAVRTGRSTARCCRPRW